MVKTNTQNKNVIKQQMKLVKLTKARGFKTKLKSVEKDFGKIPIVVLVHATWCFHCKELRPEWDAAVVASDDSEIVVVDIDSDTLQVLNSEHPHSPLTQMINKNFQGFPHILSAGKMKAKNTVNISQFNKPRTKSNITAFMRKKNT
jgi:thiol-disulfide isomerase/thioredoxin